MWEHPSKDFIVVDKKIMKEVQYLMIELQLFFPLLFCKNELQEEGKYKVELITKEGYKGSRLIIHVADSDDAGNWPCSVIFGFQFGGFMHVIMRYV